MIPGTARSSDAAGEMWRLCAVAIAGLLLAAALRFGTYAPWGTDSAAYVDAARRWSRAELLEPSELQLGPEWARTGEGVSAFGHRRGAESGTDAVIYPLGLPLLMATAIGLVGDLGPYLVAPFAGSALVLAVFSIGRSAAGSTRGAAAAALVAASPVTLVYCVLPMSDIPVTAAWMSAWAFALRTGVGAAIAGAACTALAILIRPNLAPFALVIGWTAWASQCSQPRRDRLGRVALIGIGIAAATALVLVSQKAQYGGFFSAGYQDLTALFSLSHVPDNLVNYTRFLVEVHTPLLFVGLLAPVVYRRLTSTATVVARSGAALVALNLGLYMLYVPFNDVFFLRFLLPAIVALFVLLVQVLNRFATAGGGGALRGVERSLPHACCW